MTGSKARAPRKLRLDPIVAVQERLRSGADATRATRKARRAKSREKWLGVNARTVSSAQNQVAKRYAADPDALFDVVEKLFTSARFREEKELALRLLEDVAGKLTETHLVRCMEWFPRLQDQDLVDQLARSLGATIAEMPAAQRKLTVMVRHMNPLHRRAALQCATGSLEIGGKGLRVALLVAEIATRDRAPQVQGALATLLAALSRTAPKQAMPFLARFSDDLPAHVFAAALSTLPESQQRQLEADRARGAR